MSDKNNGMLGTFTVPSTPVDPGRMDKSNRPDPEVDNPSWWQGFKASVRTGIDEQTIPQLSRLAEAYQPLEKELYRRGVTYRELHPEKTTPAEVMGDTGGAAAPTMDTLDYGAMWGAIARARRTDPQAFATLPQTQDEFERDILTRKGARARDQRITTNSSFTANLAGGAVASFANPYNVMTLPIGGVEANLARRVLFDGLLNAGIAGFELPETIVNRERMGEKTTVGDAAMEVGGAFVFGAGLPVAGRVYGETVGRAAGIALDRQRSAFSPEALAETFRNVVPPDAMTPGETRAISVLDREAEVQAISPFEPGEGSAANAERMNVATDRLLTPTSPAPPARARPTGPISTADPTWLNDYMRANRGAESGGSDAAAAGTSSAFGRYQFTKGTWLGYYTRRFGRQGLSDAEILAKRGDGAIQDQLMLDLSRENVMALRRRGHEVTPTNLYLYHFLGGEAPRMLDAASDARMESIGLKPRDFDANPWLRGKTVGQVRAILARKLGRAEAAAENARAPQLRRDVFPEGDEGNIEWRRAQAAADEAEADLARRRSRIDSEDRAPAAEDDPIPFDRGDAPVTERPLGAADDWMFEGADRAGEGAAVDAIGAGGARERIGDTPQAEERGAAPALDDTAEVRAEAIAADEPDPAIAMVDHGQGQGMTGEHFNAGEMAPSGAGIPRARLVPEDTSLQAGELRATWRDALARGDDPAPVYALRPTGGGEVVAWSPSRQVMEHTLRDPPFEGDFEVARVYPPDDFAATADPVGTGELQGFDTPDDVAAERQINSLEHDLRMAMEADGENLMMRLNDEGDVVSLADLMNDLDADEAAIDAAEKCL